jgi:hypothetical protein
VVFTFVSLVSFVFTQRCSYIFVVDSPELPQQLLRPFVEDRRQHEPHLDHQIALAAKTPGVVGRVLHECLLRVQNGERNVEAATPNRAAASRSDNNRASSLARLDIEASPARTLHPKRSGLPG